MRESHRLPAHSIPSFLGHNNVRAQKGGTALTATINCTAQTKGQQPTANSREREVGKAFVSRPGAGGAHHHHQQHHQQHHHTKTLTQSQDQNRAAMTIPKGAHLKETYRTPSPWLRAENDRAVHKDSTGQRGNVQGRSLKGRTIIVRGEGRTALHSTLHDGQTGLTHP